MNRHVPTLVFLIILAAAAFNRALHLSGPMTYDEAYTYQFFATRSLEWITSNYSLPNNHVLHSILAHFSIEAFGMQPWAIRLPAYLAGLGLVVATYHAARTLFDTHTALLSSALVAAWPVLVEFSALARGYTLVALFAMLLLATGPNLLRTPRNVWGWFAGLAALGFYAVPTMLYPTLMVMAWLVARGMLHRPATPDRWRFLLQVGVSGSVTVLLTLLLYAPILARHGPSALVGNRFVTRLEWPAFTQRLPGMLASIGEHWRADVPLGLLVLCLAGLAYALFGRRAWQDANLLILGGLAAMGLALTAQQVIPPVRVWHPVLPFFLLCAGFGIAGLLNRLDALRRNPRVLAGGVAALSLGIVLYSASWAIQATHFGRPAPGPAEQAALAIEHDLQRSDLIVVHWTDVHTLRYYLQLHGLPHEGLNHSDLSDFERVWVIVGDQTVAEVLGTGELPARLDLDRTQLFARTDRRTIYIIPRQAED